MGIFIVLKLHLAMSEANFYSFSVKLIVWVSTVQHLVAKFMLARSSYFKKYHFYSILCCFINYFYIKTYPYCNVTLTNIVFLTFAGYQVCHNLFKFSF